MKVGWMKKYFTSTSFCVGFVLVAFMGAVLIISLFWLPYDTTAMDIANKLSLPSKEHLLGTDQFGRDILSRVMKGVQVSFLIGILVVVFGGAAGIIIGSFAGYYGGKVDEVIMKLIDTQMAFPGVLLAMMLIAVFGNGISNTILALSIMAIPRFARITRSGYMKYRESDFVRAEIIRGAGNLRIMFVHILPNLTSELVATASLSFAGAVMSEAGLSYLGMGIQPPNPSLGIMLSEAQDYILSAGWYVLIPCAVITILVMGFNLVGDGIQEVNGRN